jgi:hypothetical protein
MFEPWWWMLIATTGALAALMAVTAAWWPVRTASRETRLAQARRDFHWQRERLEAKFVRLASSKSSLNAQAWDDCEFDDDVAYVKNRNTGELSAFVALTVSINAHADAIFDRQGLISNLRAGTAIFRFDNTHWETDGRAILNLTPAEAIRVYRKHLEMVDQDAAKQPSAE